MFYISNKKKEKRKNTENEPKKREKKVTTFIVFEMCVCVNSRDPEQFYILVFWFIRSIVGINVPMSKLCDCAIVLCNVCSALALALIYSTGLTPLRLYLCVSATDMSFMCPCMYCCSMCSVLSQFCFDRAWVTLERYFDCATNTTQHYRSPNYIGVLFYVPAKPNAFLNTCIYIYNHRIIASCCCWARMATPPILYVRFFIFLLLFVVVVVYFFFIHFVLFHSVIWVCATKTIRSCCLF